MSPERVQVQFILTSGHTPIFPPDIYLLAISKTSARERSIHPGEQRAPSIRNAEAYFRGIPPLPLSPPREAFAIRLACCHGSDRARLTAVKISTVSDSFRR